MCGIAGIVGGGQGYMQPTALAERLERAINCMAYRGPDDRGVWVEDRVGFGHVRLSIIDLSQRARQPLLSECGKYVLVYNGEIYNFSDIRAELETHGFGFRTESDTEVLLKAYMCWGRESFKKLNGIFAFALLDKNDRKLLLVRDRFGVKPLYYKLSQGRGLAFASELGALRELAPEPVPLNFQGLSEWAYYGTCLGENTIYSDINKLLPASWISYDLDTGAIERGIFWNALDVFSKNVSEPEVDVAMRVRELLNSAVKRQLVGDVPVGVMLSGGIDSTSILAFASACEKNIRTFSIGFDYDKGLNELPQARANAKRFGSNHSEFVLEEYDLISALETLIRAHGIPFSDAANIPLYLIAKEVRTYVKVVLQGDGGDEVFGGYRRYQVLSRYPAIRCFIPLFQVVNFLTPRTKGFYARKRFIDALLERDESIRMALLLTVETKNESPFFVFGNGLRACLRGNDPFLRYVSLGEQARNLDLVQKMFYLDSQIILPDVFCEKVDRATMTAGLEARVPFLDNHLTDYVLSLNASIKLKGGRNKYILKKALRGVVPDSVLDSPKKGFGVPYGHWLKTSLKDFFLQEVDGLMKRQPGLLDGTYINKLMKMHLTGARDFSFILWKVLCFSVWHKQYGAWITW